MSVTMWLFHCCCRMCGMKTVQVLQCSAEGCVLLYIHILQVLQCNAEGCVLLYIHIRVYFLGLQHFNLFTGMCLLTPDFFAVHIPYVNLTICVVCHTLCNFVGTFLRLYLHYFLFLLLLFLPLLLLLLFDYSRICYNGIDLSDTFV
jgi:hypothetical protein